MSIDEQGSPILVRREIWARVANGVLCRMFETPLIPSFMHMDLFAYRTADEIGMVSNLAAIPEDIAAWRSCFGVE